MQRGEDELSWPWGGRRRDWGAPEPRAGRRTGTTDEGATKPPSGRAERDEGRGGPKGPGAERGDGSRARSPEDRGASVRRTRTDKAVDEGAASAVGLKRTREDEQEVYRQCKTARRTDLRLMLAGPKGREVREISGDLDFGDHVMMHKNRFLLDDTIQYALFCGAYNYDNRSTATSSCS